jgi:hypothetical protein
MKTDQEFRAFYENELKPVLTALEAERAKAVRILFGVAAGTVALVLLSYVLIPGLANSNAIAVPALLAIAVCGLAWYGLNSGIRDKFKRGVMAKVVAFCDPGLAYSPRSHVPRADFTASRIFLHGIDRYRGEDRVRGMIGKTEVDFSEIHAQYKTESHSRRGGRRTQWHTIFKGLFFAADFNKEFHGRTVVLPDTAENLFGFIGKAFQKMDFRRDELVKLEDPEFERLFVVYGTDQIETRYILSTSLMRRITDFRNRTGKKLYLSFCRSRVHVAIPLKRNMFEPRFFRSMAGYEFADELLDDLQFALGIVEDLNLNTRIWSKQ